MEELILSRDVVELEGGHRINKNDVTNILLNRGIFPVKKIGTKNLFNKKEVEQSLKENPYEPYNKRKYKCYSHIKIDKTKYILSSDAQEIYADRLTSTAIYNFSSWAIRQGLKPVRKIKVSSRLSLNVYSVEEIEEILTQKRENKKRKEYIKNEEPLRSSDCIHYLPECLPKAAIKNKKIKCNDCQRYQKKEFNYYESM